MDLKQQGPESNMVSGEFSRTLPRAQVIKCNRVENSALQAKWMEMRQKVRAEALAQPPCPPSAREPSSRDVLMVKRVGRRAKNGQKIWSAGCSTTLRTTRTWRTLPTPRTRDTYSVGGASPDSAQPDSAFLQYHTSFATFEPFAPTRASEKARFGHGIYFGKESSYINDGLKPAPDGTRKMLICRVIGAPPRWGARATTLSALIQQWAVTCAVGRYMAGSADLTPPVTATKKGSGRELVFPSLVDNEEEPLTFVVSADELIYPAYIITYKA
jgi:hypothetical protein